VIAACKVAGFDLIVVETSGIGQGDAAIVPLVDVSLYVMTPEFGAASQLEKIDMLDFADFVAINKFDRKGAEDALRDVRKQYQRNRERFGEKPDDMPVFGTMAARFNDDGVTALYQALAPKLAERGLKFAKSRLPVVSGQGILGRARHRAGGARALPGRDRRHAARLPQGGRRAGDAGARAPVAEDRQGHLRGLARRTRTTSTN
jgi:methylmalonyl-CoA mutase